MKGALGNSRKKVEAQQLQIEVTNDDDWNYVLSKQGLLVVDVFSSWCGSCTSITGHLRRIKMEIGDECLTLATAESDKITQLQCFRGKSEPTFLLFGSGKPLCSIHGADGPALLNTIREKLQQERDIAKGKVKRALSTVLLESLVKPEEVIDTDEDLDDIESEQQESDDGEVTKDNLSEAVLLISPNIIATDRTEAFLSYIVSAGIVIVGHVQDEPSKEEFHHLLFPNKETKKEGKEEEAEDEEKIKEEGGSKSEDNLKVEKNEKDELKSPLKENENVPNKNIEGFEFWEAELGKGPLYMLLIRVEEGSIFENWDALLGPRDFRQAQLDDPDSLVARFGERSLPVPAWLPSCIELQKRLRTKFFPTLDEALPRLLLLPEEDDHQQVLEILYQGGIQVLAHTQVVLSAEALSQLDLSSSAENIEELIGCSLLAAVISGENAVSVSSDLKSLHLTISAENSIKEISQFFPDLASDLAADPSPHEDPPTQMQLEQKKETLGM